MTKLIMATAALLAIVSNASAAITPAEAKRLDAAATIAQPIRNDIPEDIWNRARCVAVIPDLKKADLAELMRLLAGPQAAARLHAQGEILSRGRSAEATTALAKLAADANAALEARVVAIFTLKQLDGPGSHPTLVQLAGDAAVREFALRALTDRKKELAGVDPALFVAVLAVTLLQLRLSKRWVHYDHT